MFRPFLLAALLFCAAGAARAAEPATGATGATPTTDPSYHLCPGDTVTISIFEEPDLVAVQTIGRSGEVRVPLIGDVILGGQTVRDAERLLETTYIQRQFLKAPVVNVVVTAYFPREISVLGAVRAPGTVVFPRDATSLDIIEVITRVGGFLPISKSDAVTITHRNSDGKESVTTVDLEAAMTGRHRAGRDRADVAVYPGDRIWVPERLF
jgi:polysaccharide export outer membrane protein